MMRHATVLALLLMMTGPSLLAQHSVHQITAKPFTIAPARHVVFEFEVPESATNVRVGGRFEASGGLRNDIQVLILDEDGYVNWRNGNSVQMYYNSGRLTQANIRAALPPGSGKYYLVFSNQFSVIANKAVLAKVGFQYDDGGDK